jgi:hypothetical protein
MWHLSSPRGSSSGGLPLGYVIEDALGQLDGLLDIRCLRLSRLAWVAKRRGEGRKDLSRVLKRAKLRVGLPTNSPASSKSSTTPSATSSLSVLERAVRWI